MGRLVRSRTPIARRGRKAKREASALATFRTYLKLRSGGRCEAAWVEDPKTGRSICGARWPHEGEHAHHVWPEDRDVGRHDVARGLWLCAASHDWVHRNPRTASGLGLLRPVSA